MLPYNITSLGPDLSNTLAYFSDIETNFEYNKRPDPIADAHSHTKGSGPKDPITLIEKSGQNHHRCVSASPGDLARRKPDHAVCYFNVTHTLQGI